VAFVGEDAAAGGQGLSRREVQDAEVLVHFAADAFQEMRFVGLVHASIVFRLLETGMPYLHDFMQA
jgi:hypothetical protein